MQIIFKKPAKFNDMLTITSQLTSLGRGSFEFMQTITNNEPALGQRNVLVEAQVKLACVNALTFKPVGIPEPIKSTMEQT
jgi:acyl-CoA thioester hydrolase